VGSNSIEPSIPIPDTVPSEGDEVAAGFGTETAGFGMETMGFSYAFPCPGARVKIGDAEAVTGSVGFMAENPR
jgi:hypothetical protein